jgi:mannose-6-phosphate isomerase-like protein (cupin superfamily)
MTKERLEELALLHAVGALDGSELEELERWLSRNNEAAIEQTTAWNTTMTSAIQRSVNAVDPPAHVKQRLMRSIRQALQRVEENPGSLRFDHAQGIYTVYPERMQWRPHPVPGVSFKVLSESKKRGYITMLMKVEPGTTFPAHHHSGEEECYVLSGSVILGGKRLGPGVLHHGDEGSDHGTLTSDEGALLFLVVAEEDYIPPAS